MKVLLLSAGNSIHTLRWANAYCERGVEVHVVTEHAPIQGYDPAVRIHVLPHLGGLGYLLNGPRVARLTRKLKPDVVNAHYASGYGSLARWCKSAPVVLNVWGSDVFAFPEKSVLHKTLLRSNLAAADRLVSTSAVMARRTASLLNNSPKVSVVPFGVDLDRFRPKVSTDRGGLVTIGTVKALEHHYGVDVLLEAFIALCGKDPSLPIQLRIVGGGGESGRLKERAEHSGCGARITFVGAVPHSKVPDELSKLDIYVALSREESFGVAVLEAQACGIPVVVSKVGGLPEVVQDGVAGFVVPSEDVEAATEALSTLVNDAGLRDRMGAAGRAFVAANYAWEACVDRQLSVLQEVIDDPKRA